MRRRYTHKVESGDSSGIAVRLALEALADRLADEEAAALQRWREASAARHAAELALREFPEVERVEAVAA